MIDTESAARASLHIKRRPADFRGTRRPYIPLGCTQQGRLVPTLERKAASALPDLLLSTGAMEGPFRRTRPITRWSRAARRFTRALLAFLLAPRINL